MSALKTGKLHQNNGHLLDNNSKDNNFVEEHVQSKRGRKKREDKDSTRNVNFVLSWDLDARLDQYVAGCKRKEHRIVERSGVVEQVLDKFLTDKGYPPNPEDC